ncbi:group II intron reverse transcriptase/maturase [Myxococcus sp. SDU36]|nr:group II intron reverse transcriptase/maturase [Myxococcus sp. SDU36]
MAGTPSPIPISTRLQRIATLARQGPDMAFTTLAHHIDIDWLREAHRRVRKDGAVGVDGQTAQEYAARLEDHLHSLLGRMKSGTYRAPPVRRVHIPKGQGKTRPIGIPTFEDKLLQRAVAMVLEAVYEQDFLSCSYGFRPGRSAHLALEALWQQSMEMNGGWVLEVDIQSFFDTLDHGQLLAFLQRRVRDGVLLRLIGKWFNAGVLEDGAVVHPEEGTPQGGVISPLLANVYLHEVLDVWFERQVRPRLVGRAALVRYADDFVVLFTREKDARRVMAVLSKRFSKYGLTLHPEKTRLVQFPRPPRSATKPLGARPRSFDFLGFTHYWGKTLKGRWAVQRKTTSSRMSRALSRMTDWCRINRHLPVAEQHRGLVQKVRGHYAYYGISGNTRSLTRFLYWVAHTWRKWLGRRSQRATLAWERFARLLQRYPLPPVRIIHRYRTLAAKP